VAVCHWFGISAPDASAPRSREAALRALLYSLRLAQDTTGAEGGLYAQVTLLAG